MTPRKLISTALKGFGMGAANVVPGVSGGTIALLTGIYSDIVDAINSFTTKGTWSALLHGRFREFWKGIKGSFLLALGVGMIVSVFSLAKLMTLALKYYPILTWAFFFGLIVASAILIFRGIKGWGLKEVLLLLGGIALGVLVCTLSPTSTTEELWFIFLCGAISICSMILPGVSGSFVLLIMGKYDFIMTALTELNWAVLGVFAAGCLVGILAFAKLLHWLLGRWEKQTMLVLLGFVLGSLVKVWPWSDAASAASAQLLRAGLPAPDDPSLALQSISALELQIPGALLCCAAGISLVIVLDRLSRR